MIFFLLILFWTFKEKKIFLWGQRNGSALKCQWCKLVCEFDVPFTHVECQRTWIVRAILKSEVRRRACLSFKIHYQDVMIK